jgi:adenylate cyclase
VARPNPRTDLPDSDAKANARWRAVLLGDSKRAPGLAFLRRIFRHLPSDPRCKLCYAPYALPFGPVVSAMGFGRWHKNPSLCGSCLRIMERAQGGAEVELSMLFADLRGSTQVAGAMSASAFSRMLNVFYGIAAQAVQGRGGSVDKYLGDGIFALFIPGFTGPDHAARAIDAARQILDQTRGSPEPPRAGTVLPVGIGVHTGVAYVGVVGRSGDLTDFTALGDAVNITERLSSAAGAGELLISDAALNSSGYPSASLTSRQLTLKGVTRPVAAWSESAPGAPVPTGI